MGTLLEKHEFWDNLEELSEGTEKPVVEDGIVGKLMQTYDSAKGKYVFEGDIEKDRNNVYAIEKKIKKGMQNLSYSGKDIVKLVDSMQMRNFDEKESKDFGAYTGALISILTKRIAAEGKRTTIKIE